MVTGVERAGILIRALGVVAGGAEDAHAVVDVAAVGGGVIDVPAAGDVVQLWGPDLGAVPAVAGRGPDDGAFAPAGAGGGAPPPPPPPPAPPAPGGTTPPPAG